MTHRGPQPSPPPSYHETERQSDGEEDEERVTMIQASPRSSGPSSPYRWFAVLCVIALLTASLHENVQLRVQPASHDPNFEFLLFSQQSSAGYCAGHGHCIKPHIRPFWTIHGLWPSNDTAWPESCNLTMKFDIQMLDPIRAELDQFWPSVSGYDSEYFWSHEWHKHGSCALALPQLSGVLRYFNGTLQLAHQYNVTKFLIDSNIVPTLSRTYNVDDVLNALSEDLRTKANVVCRQADGYAYPVLSEVRFCLSKTTLMPVDCRSKHEHCGSGQLFYIPVGAGPGGTGFIPGTTGWSQHIFVNIFAI